MFKDLQPLLQSFSNPHIVHSTLVHLPLAFSALGLMMLLALLITAGRVHWLRGMVVLLFAFAAGLAYLSYLNGRMIEPNDPGAALGQSLETHKWLGKLAWIPLATAALLVALTTIQFAPWRVTALSLSLLAAIFSIGWLVLTAHHGWQLAPVHAMSVDVAQGPQEEGYSAGPASLTTNSKIHTAQEAGAKGDKPTRPSEDTQRNTTEH